MPRKIVLGYSGGLDTSVIVPWLRETYGADIVCMAADVGQGDDPAVLEAKALASGASSFHFEDLREAFLRDFVWPTLRAGAVYGRKYLLGTAMARPIIARRQVELAREVGADALAHGCTGRGNDQVRFELTFGAMAPDLPVIAPWREWHIRSREEALAYARERGIPLEGVDETKLYSRDENLWHISHEGGPLEDPAVEPDPSVFRWTRSPEEAPDEAEYVTIDFEEGRPTAVNGEPAEPVELLTRLNRTGSLHGVGRADIVEDRMVGMKSRGIYETPGGTILHEALRELEAITLDRRTMALKDRLAPTYADLVYEGRWWTPEREAIDAMVDRVMEPVTGTVRMKLFKGGATCVGREAETSLYRADLATFGASATFDHADAEGFIRLFGLPSRVVAATRAAASRGPVQPGTKSAPDAGPAHSAPDPVSGPEGVGPETRSGTPAAGEPASTSAPRRRPGARAAALEGVAGD